MLNRRSQESVCLDVWPTSVSLPTVATSQNSHYKTGRGCLVALNSPLLWWLHMGWMCLFWQYVHMPLALSVPADALPSPTARSNANINIVPQLFIPWLLPAIHTYIIYTSTSHASYTILPGMCMVAVCNWYNYVFHIEATHWVFLHTSGEMPCLSCASLFSKLPVICLHVHRANSHGRSCFRNIHLWSLLGL